MIRQTCDTGQHVADPKEREILPMGTHTGCVQPVHLTLSRPQRPHATQHLSNSRWPFIFRGMKRSTITRHKSRSIDKSVRPHGARIVINAQTGSQAANQAGRLQVYTIFTNRATSLNINLKQIES